MSFTHDGIESRSPGCANPEDSVGPRSRGEILVSMSEFGGALDAAVDAAHEANRPNIEYLRAHLGEFSLVEKARARIVIARWEKHERSDH